MSEYEVQAIIGKRRKKNNGAVEYRVLWKGYPKQQATWEPEDHLENVDYMIEQFNRKVQQKSNAVSQQKKQPASSPPQPTQLLKKPIDQVDQKRKEVTQRPPPKRSLKESDSDEDKDKDDEDNYEVKPHVSSVQTSRPKPQMNKPVEQPKPVERKYVPSPVVKSVAKTFLNENESGVITSKRPLLPQNKNINQPIIKENQLSEDEEPEAETNLELNGMFLLQNGKYGFSVLDKKSNKRITLKRSQVIKRDPLALIKYYEKNLSISN